MKVAILYDGGSEEWSEADVAAVLANVHEVRRSLRRHGHVGCRDQARAAAERRALHARHDRLRRAIDRFEQPGERAGVLEVLLPREARVQQRFYGARADSTTLALLHET